MPEERAKPLHKHDLLTIPSAAEWIGVSRQSLYKMVGSGRIASMQTKDPYGNDMRLIRREDLDVYVATRVWTAKPVPGHYVSSLAGHELATLQQRIHGGKLKALARDEG